ncbi:hypothetical protein HG535_0F05850 [Zygotorulaspora mrakii]|uniref:Golgi apparatus membrane protein TVP38 n=1 Tax=Zygotorulaspora mrakii TaxID=42260 RepID=A0A7H9B6E0_ZYGMR|nr:uncharacterized protein HG535_0F05850 [Zygotorulaspora mrakii]QLG74073.1 hypothetical protein HG535_0F05850 [Zygotorulaspora mrakii]
MSFREGDLFEDSFLGDFGNESNTNDLGDRDDDDDFLDVYNLTPRQRLGHSLQKMSRKLVQQYNGLPWWQRYLAYFAGTCLLIAGITLLVFHDRILHRIVETSNELKDEKRTSFVLVALIFVVAFPPLIGFSLLGTITGLIYEMSFQGWLILAVGAVAGSIASFATFKTVLHSRAESLVHSNRRFEAFSSLLRENNSFWILALLRLCPFPYSLTNGAMAAIYGLSIKNFAIAQFIVTPKLLIYLFIGSRIKNIGETKSASSKILNLLSILATMAILTITAWILYFKTQRKYAELQRRDQQLNADSNQNAAFDASFDI